MTITVETGGGTLRMESHNIAIQSMIEVLAAKLKYLGPVKMEEFLREIKTSDGTVSHLY